MYRPLSTGMVQFSRPSISRPSGMDISACRTSASTLMGSFNGDALSVIRLLRHLVVEEPALRPVRLRLDPELQAVLVLHHGVGGQLLLRPGLPPPPLPHALRLPVHALRLHGLHHGLERRDLHDVLAQL